jgi:hypothetical protein
VADASLSSYSRRSAEAFASLQITFQLDVDGKFYAASGDHTCKMYGRLLNVREPVTKRSQTRTKYPSQEDWDLHRNEIKRLYVEENLPLREVAQQMEKRFRFRATYAIKLCLEYEPLTKQGWRCIRIGSKNGPSGNIIQRQ